MSSEPISALPSFTPTDNMLITLVDPSRGVGNKNGQCTRAALLSSGFPYDMVMYVPGAYTASQEMVRFPMVRTVNYAINFAPSRAKCDGAASATATVLIQKSGATIGTITFAAGEMVGTLSGVLAGSFLDTDDFTLIAPAVPDPTLSGVQLTFAGTR